MQTYKSNTRGSLPLGLLSVDDENKRSRVAEIQYVVCHYGRDVDACESTLALYHTIEIVAIDLLRLAD